MVEDALQLVVLRNSPVADQLAQLPLQHILQEPGRPHVGVKANIPAEVRESAFQYWQQPLVVPSP